MTRYPGGLALAIVIFLTHAACGGNGDNPGQGPTQAGPIPGPTQSAIPSASQGRWTELTERTACEVLNPNDCVGAYGFHLTPQGEFTAGPDPSGRIMTGRIGSLEIQAVDNDVAQLTQADLNARLACQSSQMIVGIQDNVTLQLGQLGQLGQVGQVGQAGQQSYLLYEGESIPLHGSDCTSGDPAKEERLHSDLNAIMKKYYPIPFSSVATAGPAPAAQP